jgi:uncharacterized lipoprotein YajG
MRRIRHAALVALCAQLPGCASFAPPQPWEKQYLAVPSMQFDVDKLDVRSTQHIYFSREAATGGYGVGGGGCGCN